MSMPRARALAGGLVLAALSLAWSGVARPAAQPAPLDVQWQAFWRAASPAAAAVAATRLVDAGVDFDDAWRRLSAGRTYAKSPTGERNLRAPGPAGVAFDNYVEVPAEYDPARRWPVRVQLHGGVGRPTPEAGQRRRANRIPPSAPEIVVHPFAWGEAAWWHGAQVDNVLALLDRVKREYNVDESRVYLTGTSDGATGAFFLAMRAPTPWASVLPLIGHLAVLANRSTAPDGELFVTNLMNRPFFVVNGVRDPLYPAARVAPYLETLEEAGVTLTFRPQASGGHDTSWWESERPAYEAFVREHPRAAHPPALSWTTERVDRYNRVHWLVVDELGARASDAPLRDVNTVAERYDADFGLRGDARQDAGTRVVQVVPGTAAAAMGVREGDRLLEIDGQPIAAMADIVAAFERNRGPTIHIVVERDGERLELNGPFPPEPERGAARRLFPRRDPSGRVDVAHRGNTFMARTRGVARFTVLLSPDAIDFARPVRVVVNDVTVHDGVVARDVRTLLTWAARDDDRTMLYGAALSIAVPQ